MKDKMIKRFLILLLCASMPFSLTGCWSARELNALTIVSGIGIDKSEKSGNILLTAQIVKPSELVKPSTKSAGGGAEAFWNIENSSDSVFDTFREFTHEASNRMYIAHNQVIILGSKLAAEGVQKHLDFFMRAHETRPTTLILVAKDKAADALNIKPELGKLPAMNIAKLSKAQGLTSQAMDINFQNFTARLMSKTTSPIAPLLSVKGEGEGKTLHIEGMAVFKKDKMVGTLNEVETRGLLWVTGKVKTGAINLACPGGKATLEIVKSKSKLTPEIKNDTIYMHVQIKEEGVLVAQTSSEDLATLPAFAELEKRQSNAIRNEIMASLKKARKLNTDYFGFGDELHKKYRKEWKELEKNWDEIFPTVQVEIEIESKIRATGLITKPAVPEKEE